MHDVAVLSVLLIACIAAFFFWAFALLVLTHACWEFVTWLNREKGWFR